jgi:nitrogen regulatory protein P-II 1
MIKEDTMKKIEAIIRPTKLDDVYVALKNAGCPGLMMSEIEGQGKQKGIVQEFRGKEYRTELLTKLKIEIVVNDEDVDKICDAICRSALTGKEGDGRIFIYNIEETLHIRTGGRSKSIS